MDFSDGYQKRQIFFDLDDTLIDDNYKFEMTSCDCTKAIILGFETESPSINEIVSEYVHIDTERVKKLPQEKRFVPSRFAESWHLTYDTLCAKYHKTPKRATHMMLEGLALQNFEPPYFVVPGAVDVLIDLLRTGKYELRILSAGDSEVQERKVDMTDLTKHFASKHFFSGGDKFPALEEAAKKFGQKNVWMIGNSTFSDINPALRAGVNAIYIPRGSWSVWKAEPLNDKYLQLHDISEVPQALEHWQSNDA